MVSRIWPPQVWFSMPLWRAGSSIPVDLKTQRPPQFNSPFCPGNPSSGGPKHLHWSPSDVDHSLWLPMFQSNALWVNQHLVFLARVNRVQFGPNWKCSDPTLFVPDLTYIQLTQDQARIAKILLFLIKYRKTQIQIQVKAQSERVQNLIKARENHRCRLGLNKLWTHITSILF